MNKLTSNQLRERFQSFFESKGHVRIPSASLVPENDPSSLFTTAGMQPLVPYLMGQTHPSGTRLVDAQKCVRTGDIDDVGDNRHLTFFEMLGNWSLGDYFKNDSIRWSYEFLTDEKIGLGIDPTRLYVTVFKGENGIPRDEESIKTWTEVFEAANLSRDIAENGIIAKGIRIVPLGTDDNFWIAGAVGPCGADTEIFYDTRPEEGELNGIFEDYIKSFRLIEIWNNVFMEFNKTADGKYEKLAKQNVDTGMGLERTVAVLNGKANVFETDAFLPIIELIRTKATVKDQIAERVVADHMRAAIFMIGDQVFPSNTDRGYILRRILRRAIRFSDKLGITDTQNLFNEIVELVIRNYSDAYPELKKNEDLIKSEIMKEEAKFKLTLINGLKQFEKISDKDISGEDAFTLFSTYGFPIEVTLELAREKNLTVDKNGFAEEMKKHQELSKVGSEQKFKGGLADASPETTRLHTATHLLHKALKMVLGDQVNQKGSNITPERLRFDFNHSEKMTPEQLKQVEEIVNEAIKKDYPVSWSEMTVEEAKNSGAIGLFEHKYGDKIKLYKVGDFSMEICGGPHVEHTGELKGFKILKEEAVGAGLRRIKAQVNANLK